MYSTSRAHGHFARVENQDKGRQDQALGWQEINVVFQMPVVVYDVIMTLKGVKDEIEKIALACGWASKVVGARVLGA